MPEGYFIKKVSAADKDFQYLIHKLDHELWNELKEDQATYDKFNKVDHIPTGIIIYYNNVPVACGCFKEYDKETVEIKRMFVVKEHRGKGLSKQILNQLEQWAFEKNYCYAVLETSVYFKTARTLYETNGYSVIANYGAYAHLKDSVCMKKLLKNHQVQN